MPLAGLAFDGIAAVGALVRSGISNALTGAALTQGAGFRGASGIFRLRNDGTNERGLAVATIREQAVVVLEGARKPSAAPVSRIASDLCKTASGAEHSPSP